MSRGLWRELRPYLALWPAIVRLAVGTWRLIGRVTSLCMAGEGSDKAWRALGLLAAAEFGRRCAVQAPLLMAPVTVLWLVFAWRHGPAPAKPAAPDDDREQTAADGEPEEQPLPDRAQLAAALHHVGDPHAHLSALAAHLKEPAPRVRAALEEAGIPTAGGVRAGGRVSTGVKQQDFPPLLPSPSDSPGDVVVAGQPGNNNTRERKPYLSREGFWITPDPERPHGWNVAAPRT